jgi:ADP-heptose:LPS heptosyltransferase
MIPFHSIQRIAVIRRNGLGDVLCSLPLVLRCKELMPQAKITLFVEKNAFSLAPYLQGPDEVALIPSSGNKYLNILKLAWQKRNESFDLAISAKTMPMKLMNFSLCALRASYRTAYVQGDWHDRLINHSKLYQPQNNLHQALQAIHLIDPEMKELPRRLYPILRLANQEKLFAKKTLLISVSNNRIGSTLPPQRLAHLLNSLATEESFAVAISGLPKDFAKAQEIASLLKMEHKIFATKQLSHFITLLNSADAIFSSDGGIVHLSAALQKPALYLFGGVKVSQWGPLSKKALTLFHQDHVMDIPEGQILQALRAVLHFTDEEK